MPGVNTDVVYTKMAPGLHGKPHAHSRYQIGKPHTSLTFLVVKSSKNKTISEMLSPKLTELPFRMVWETVVELHWKNLHTPASPTLIPIEADLI